MSEGFPHGEPAALSRELEAAAARVIASGRFVLDAEVGAFEREFAAYCGSEHCVAVANGTDALELALRAAGIGEGDGVATVANAGGYATAAIEATGAAPVYVEIGDDLTMSPAAFSRVAAEVRAVVVTHLYGRVADIARLADIATQAGATVVEDCAQAHGARSNGRHVGTFARMGAFSFYPTKNLGALGDGGAVVTSDASLAATLRELRQYGWRQKYHVVRRGGRNSRLDELQAAFLRVKLPHLARDNDARLVIANRYREALRGLPVIVPPWRDDEFVAHLFVIRCRERDVLRARLASEGIVTDVHYPVADHMQPARFGSALRLPLTEAACDEVVTLPCRPGMAMSHIDSTIAAIRRHFDEKHG